CKVLPKICQVPSDSQATYVGCSSPITTARSPTEARGAGMTFPTVTQRALPWKWTFSHRNRPANSAAPSTTSWPKRMSGTRRHPTYPRTRRRRSSSSATRCFSLSRWTRP
ncbi:hypothetical protein DYB28_007822, partial [Aphanomyces astaci]